MLLIIRGSRNTESSIKAAVFKMFDRKAVLRVENSTLETIELIYEFSVKALGKAEKKEKNSVCDTLYAIGQIEYVNIVRQNDEISG